MLGMKYGGDYRGWTQMAMISPVAKNWPPVTLQDKLPHPANGAQYPEERVRPPAENALVEGDTQI